MTEGAGEQLRVRARIHIAAQAGQRSREALVAEEKDCETAKRKAGEPAPKARAITRSNSDGNGSGSGKRQLRRANSAGAMPNTSRAQRRRPKKKKAEDETTEEEDAPKRWIAKSLTLARLLQQAPAKGLQRALTVELETAEEKALVVEALDVKPPLDWAAQSESEQLKRFFAATAFLCSDAISRQAITALAPKYTLRNSEFGTHVHGLPPGAVGADAGRHRREGDQSADGRRQRHDGPWRRRRESGEPAVADILRGSIQHTAR